MAIKMIVFTLTNLWFCLGREINQSRWLCSNKWRKIRCLENPPATLSVLPLSPRMYTVGMDYAPAPALVYGKPSPYICKCSLQILYSVAFDWKLVLQSMWSTDISVYLLDYDFLFYFFISMQRYQNKERWFYEK